MSAEIPWEAWFHKEHADANRLLTENYLLRKALEAALRQAIVALREEEAKNEASAVPEKTLMEEVAELRAVFNGPLGGEPNAKET